MSNPTRTIEDISPAVPTLTTAYTGWESDWFDCLNFDKIKLFLGAAKADSTSIELQSLVEEVGGTTGYKEFRVVAGAAALDEVAITSADLAASDTFALFFDCGEFARVKFNAKKTGGSGTATLTVGVMAGGQV